VPVMRARRHRTNTEETLEWLAVEFAPAGSAALREMRSPGDVRAGARDTAVAPGRYLKG